MLAPCAYTGLKISLGLLQLDWAVYFHLIHTKATTAGKFCMLGFWISKVLGARGKCEEFIDQNQVARKLFAILKYTGRNRIVAQTKHS